MGPSYICEDAVSKVPIIDLDALMGKELNDVVCAAYRMGCEQTREVYQKRIEMLEAALRTVKEWHGYGLPLETTRIIDAALEGKDD